MKREKTPITEIHLNPVLEGLNMSQDEFTDFCILLGCDYCDKIRGKLGTIQRLQFPNVNVIPLIKSTMEMRSL